MLLGDGTLVRPRVVATFSRSLGLADVLLPWQSVQDHLAAPMASTMLLDAPGRDLIDLRAGVRQATGDDTAHVSGREDMVGTADAEAELNLWLVRRLLGLVALLAAVSVVSTLLAVTTSRRSEFAALRLVGASRRQVRRMVAVERALLWLTGVLTGGGVAAWALAPVVADLGGGSVAGRDVCALGLVGIGLAVTCLSATSSGARMSMAGPVSEVARRTT